jgi:hypothetical protein
VLQTFTWGGGVGDPITLEFQVSQVNAMQLKMQQQAQLQTTAVSSLAWWIADYDREAKKWFEQSYPLSGSIAGVVTRGATPSLNVDLAAIAGGSGSGTDVSPYKIRLSVAPAANLPYTLMCANSASMKVVKSWGLQIGSVAAAGYS